MIWIFKAAPISLAFASKIISLTLTTEIVAGILSGGMWFHWKGISEIECSKISRCSWWRRNVGAWNQFESIASNYSNWNIDEVDSFSITDKQAPLPSLNKGIFSSWHFFCSFNLNGRGRTVYEALAFRSPAFPFYFPVERRGTGRGPPLLSLCCLLPTISNSLNIVGAIYTRGVQGQRFRFPRALCAKLGDN